MYGVLAVRQEPGNSAALVRMQQYSPTCGGLPNSACARMWGRGQRQLWDSAILQQWAAVIATESLEAAHMGRAAPHDMGTELIRQVPNESYNAHTRARTGLIKARAVPRGTMAWGECLPCERPAR